jgi:hypothetical protein
MIFNDIKISRQLPVKKPFVFLHLPASHLSRRFHGLPFVNKLVKISKSREKGCPVSFLPFSITSVIEKRVQAHLEHSKNWHRHRVRKRR